jgi:glycosyltransferase involved in cell wall biosynthesis
VDIARSCGGTDLIVFPENRGYGAAIKAGWNAAGGDLLGFLDADGTCDPRYFAPMCRKILDGNQDVVLGCRMGPESRMPLTRRIGNTLFALLLGFLSKKKVRDTASGMRVVRREALPKLLPLPDGLHFTPAMSARALMDDEVRIAEIDMRYHERIGESKLRVLRDGFRFLSVILSAAAYIRVSRLTIPIIMALGLAGVSIMVRPTGFYLANGRLEEWMFYRFAFAGMLGTIAVTALCATIVSEHVSALTLLRYERFGSRTRGLWRYENLRLLAVAAGLLWLVGAFLNLGGLRELMTTGHVSLHWSRVMLGAFFSINLAQMIGALCSVKIIRALHQRQPFLHSENPNPGTGP